MCITFREYMTKRDIQEYGAPTPGAPTPGVNPDNPNAAAADPKTTQAVQQAKQALSNPGVLDDKAKRDLETSKNTLEKAKTDKDRVEVSKLVQELDPATQGKPGMTPTAMMKRRMKKK